MSTPLYNDEQLILAARLYFLDGLPQAQIGKLVNVSQSKVSRMLALARERGLVRITVPEYDPRNGGLEEELRRRLHVEAVVIRSVEGLGVEERRQTIGYFAAPVVSGWLAAARRVAVAGGRTMQALVEQMKPTQVPATAATTAQPRRDDLTVIQAMGNIDSSPGLYDAAELGRVLARRWGGTFLTLSTPAILPDPETCRRLLDLEQIQGVMEQLGRADLALVGIGTLANSVFLEREVLGPADLETLRGSGAVGEVLGRFFDKHGQECATAFQRRVVSLGLNELRQIPRKVGVVAGADRAQAVLAAVAGGLLNALVIDEGGASALLEVAR